MDKKPLKRLVPATQAKPAKRQHTKPCGDCPWARTALNGWLGGTSAADWLQHAHGETVVDCHTVGNQQCAGLAIYRANVCKTPREKANLKLPADTVRVFASPAEFRKHHEDDFDDV